MLVVCIYIGTISFIYYVYWYSISFGPSSCKLTIIRHAAYLCDSWNKRNGTIKTKCTNKNISQRLNISVLFLANPK